MLLFFSGMATLKAQSELKHLKPDDYKQWHRLRMGETSPAGERISYYLTSAHAQDTLVIASLKHGGASRKIVGGKNANFLAYRNRFLYVMDERLVIEDESGKEVRVFNGVKEHKALQQGRYLLLSSAPTYSTSPKTITIVDMEDFRQREVPNSISLSIDRESNQVAVSVPDSKTTALEILTLNHWESKRVPLLTSAIPTNLQWSADNRSLTFVLVSSDSSETPQVVCYMPDVSKPEKMQQFRLDKVLTDAGVTLLTHDRDFPKISEDRKRILLLVEHEVEEKDEDNGVVEVWRTNAKRLYPYRNRNVPETFSKLASFDLETETLNVITKPSESEFRISSDGVFTIHTDQSDYIPAYRFGKHYADIRVTNIPQRKELQLEDKLPSSPLLFVDNQTVLYRKGKDWWEVGLKTNKKVNISDKIPEPLTQCRNCYNGIAESTDGKSFFILGQHDLWRVNSEDLSTERLTNGKDDGVELRFASSIYGHRNPDELLTLNTSDGIFLQAWNRWTGETGYYKWTEKSGLEEIVFKDKKVSFLQVLSDNKGYVYMQESFDLSPQIVWKAGVGEKEIVITSSNPQQKQYHWGKSEMVHYSRPS